MLRDQIIEIEEKKGLFWLKASANTAESDHATIGLNKEINLKKQVAKLIGKA